MAVGVSLVIAVAVVFFHKELPAVNPTGENAAATAVQPSPPDPGAHPGSAHRPALGKTMARGEEGASQPAGRRHTVQPGDTLFSLAQHYYGNPDRFGEIYRINRDVLKAP